MKKLAGLICSFCLVVVAQAAPPTQASIEKLLVVTDVEKLVGSMQGQIEAMMKGGMDQAFEGQTLTPEGQKITETYRKKMVGQMNDQLGWAKIKDLYIQIYSETFTQEEIDGLIAFYQSPTGRTFVEKMPVVMQKSMTLMQARMGPLMEAIQQSIKDATQEVKETEKK